MTKKRIRTNTSPRAISKIELNTIEENIDWDEIRKIFYPTKKNRGRKKVFTHERMFKLCKLQDMLGIEHDTRIAAIIKENEVYQRFCDFKIGETPSHDVISRFKREISFDMLFRIFKYIDVRLDELNFFENDNLCVDGTNIPLNPKSKIATWGAKSNHKKFCGLWLLTLNSTKREIIRDFTIDTAKIGQIKLFYRLVRKLDRERFKDCEYLIADGIFDNEKSYRSVKRNINSVPIIPYNPRKSKIKSSEDLPDDNWRFKYAKQLRNVQEFKKLFKTRTSVERENSRIKTLSLIKNIGEISKICPRITSKWIVTQIILSIISINLSALAQHTYNLKNPIPIQTTITDFYAIA